MYNIRYNNVIIRPIQNQKGGWEALATLIKSVTMWHLTSLSNQIIFVYVRRVSKYLLYSCTRNTFLKFLKHFYWDLEDFQSPSSEYFSFPLCWPADTQLGVRHSLFLSPLNGNTFPRTFVWILQPRSLQPGDQRLK